MTDDMLDVAYLRRVHVPDQVQTGSKTHGGPPEYATVCRRDRNSTWPCELIRALDELDRTAAEVVRLREVIDGVRELQHHEAELGYVKFHSRLAELLVRVPTDYTEDDGEQDNAIDGLMRHVGMPRPHGKHYLVDERPDPAAALPDVTDDEAGS